MRNRSFVKGACIHIYQKPIYGCVIFQTMFDYLAFITIATVIARRHNIKLLCVCPMPDHIHLVVEAGDKDELSAFVREYTSIFVKQYNISLDRTKGKLFTSRFGSAPKKTDKDVRSCLAYGYNNPVERNICESPEEYRWNLLAYAKNDNPFSNRLADVDCSERMKKDMKLVRKWSASDQWLGYDRLKSLFDGLSHEESETLCDYIITTYKSVDYQSAIAYYGNYDAMLNAFRNNTGYEREIKENWTGYTDRVYSTMRQLIQERNPGVGIKDILKMSVADREKVYAWMERMNRFNPKQIRKFLHLKPLKLL